MTCTGQGLCAELLPELIDLDEWGSPILKDRAVPDQLRTHARRAVAVCPAWPCTAAGADRDQQSGPGPAG
ncbi:ferredoxin [Streptomyces sp. NPDC001816]|uniref:ferredoxin n=1 Tax=Streptomyces sp. NPDC001816 TaxID=3364612 RepID=UPI0036AA75C6